MSDNTTGWLDPFLEGARDYHLVKGHWYYISELDIRTEVATVRVNFTPDYRLQQGPSRIDLVLVHTPWKGCC